MDARWTTCLLIAATALCCAWDAAGNGDEPAAAQPLRIVAEHYPPYEFVRDGVTTGINVEVTARIMGRIGVPHDFSPTYPFSRAWALIRSGNAEAAASVSCQPERDPYTLCSAEQRAFNETGVIPRDYLWITRYVFFAHRRYANVLRFESYEQLRREDLRIGICKDYTYDGKLVDAKLNTVMFIVPEDGFKALAAGDIDLFPMDETIGHWMLGELALSDTVVTLPGAVVEKPYLMMFAKKSPYPGLQAICLRYYEELRKMGDSGEYADIVNRYIRPRYPYPLPRPLVFVAEEWAPFEYLKDGKPSGIDVEVVKRVMSRLNLPFNIQLYPWSRAWMLAERGHADAVLSVSYKDSREPFLFYTLEQRAFAETGELPSDYLWMSEYVFFVKRSRAGDLRFESYEQIKRDGYRVGTNRDYTYSPDFLAADLSVREYPDAQSGMAALVNGDIDIYPMDRTVGLAQLKESGLAEAVAFVPKPLFSKPYLCPFVRGSDMPGIDALMDAFNAQLRLLRATGEYEELVARLQREGSGRD